MICFNWKEAVLSWTKKKQGNKKEKLTESLHLTVKIARRSNYKIDLRKLRVNKITGRWNQPQSQGSLLPSPMERERETLENAGHVSPRRKKNQEGSLFLKVLSPQIFVNINTRQTFLVRDLPCFVAACSPRSSIAATGISILNRNK